MNLRMLILVLAWALASESRAGEWAVVGAGNATCMHWSTGDRERQTEILSWMAGFASALNLDLASEGKPEYQLEYLTYDYLRNEIKAACFNGEGKDKTMSIILFSIMTKLPVHSK